MGTCFARLFALLTANRQPSMTEILHLSRRHFCTLSVRSCKNYIDQSRTDSIDTIMVRWIKNNQRHNESAVKRVFDYLFLIEAYPAFMTSSLLGTIITFEEATSRPELIFFQTSFHYLVGEEQMLVFPALAMATLTLFSCTSVKSLRHFVAEIFPEESALIALNFPMLNRFVVQVGIELNRFVRGCTVFILEKMF